MSWSAPTSRPSSCSSNPGGLALAPSSTADVASCVSALCPLGVASARDRDVTVSPSIDAAAFDRLEARRAVAQPLQRLRRPPHRRRARRPRAAQIVAKSPGSNAGTRVERRREGQRLAFLDR